MKQINLEFNYNEAYPISTDLFGIFFEDINFSCDGGINANMVNNYSFDGIYFNEQHDYLRYWNLIGGKIESSNIDPLSVNSRYARISVEGSAVLQNLGYNVGQKSYKDMPAMSIISKREYEYSCYIRGDFKGTINVSVVNMEGETLTDLDDFEANKDWQNINISLLGIKTGYGKLNIAFDGKGHIDIDCVSLMDRDYWNKGDNKWSGGKFRKDIVEAIADLKPQFMRFPGGCIVEGRRLGNQYNWKDTVGELYQRKSKYNLWGAKVPEGGYNQSYQIGFYEYFCLCEDLKMKPLPTLSAGIICQVRSFKSINIDSDMFKDEIIANYIDLIEFANGDPNTSQWASLRAQMGHPEPFNMEMIGVGNENFGPQYRKRFKIIEKAIHNKYPEIKLVNSSLGLPWKWALASIWRFAKKYNRSGYLDEHYYHSPEWFIRNSTRYDNYERGTTKVYIGEYAANGMWAGKFPTEEKSNYYKTAIGEAVFLTGIERNADIVSMTSYAPLLNLAGGLQWAHNLIEFNPSCVNFTANYLVQKLFGANIGNKYLPFSGRLPKGIFVSATEDEQKVYIKVVNLNSEDYFFSSPLSGQSASLQFISSDDLNAKNKLKFFGKPEYKVEISTKVISISENLNSYISPNSVNVITIVK